MDVQVQPRLSTRHTQPVPRLRPHEHWSGIMTSFRVDDRPRTRRSRSRKPRGPVKRAALCFPGGLWSPNQRRAGLGRRRAKERDPGHKTTCRGIRDTSGAPPAEKTGRFALPRPLRTPNAGSKVEEVMFFFTLAYYDRRSACVCVLCNKRRRGLRSVLRSKPLPAIYPVLKVGRNSLDKCSFT